MTNDQLVQNSGAYLALFGVAVITILVLVAVVVMQNRKIRDLQAPKFGFLGKPINAAIFIMVVLSSFSLFVYYTNNEKEVDNTVSVNDNFELQIEYSKNNSNLYIFKAIALVDGEEYGNSSELTFDVLWTVTGEDILSHMEVDVSLDRPSNYQVKLTPGSYTITATIFVLNVEFNKTIQLEVE